MWVKGVHCGYPSLWGVDATLGCMAAYGGEPFPAIERERPSGVGKRG